MTNPLEEFKDVPYGRWAALGHRLGGLGAVEAMLKNDDLARQVKKMIADATFRDTPGTAWEELLKLHKDNMPIAWFEVQAFFYKEVFGLTVDLSEVKLPPETEGFGWTVAIAKELGDKPLATAMAACKKLFGGKVYQYADDLDKAVPTNDRTPTNGSYAIRVRDRVEADEENKNLSADDIKSRNMATMTLLERVVLELFYFWKTGKHLDIQNWTLCSGSRYSDGGVPRCDWRGGRFWVCWRASSDCYGDLRAREAVLA